MKYGDLIDRQTAIDALNGIASDLHARKRLDEEYIASWCAETIEQLPSAQPEIIRCGKCTHKDKKIDYCHYLGITICEHDYCSYAERRTDE